MGSYSTFELEVTVVSAKQLKNVNWKNGDLKPYAIIYLDSSDHKLTTHADDYGSTRPVWNKRFTLPVTRSIFESVLTVEIFHSRPSETPKPLVGAVKIPLSQILDSERSPTVVRDVELIRPSGRPQGKVRLMLALKECPLPPPPSPRPPPPPSFPQVYGYQNAPNYSQYYTSLRPPNEFFSSRYAYPDQYGYYSGPSRPLFDSSSNYSPENGPSAPVYGLAPGHKPVPPPSVSASTTCGGYGGLGGPSAPVDYSSENGKGEDVMDDLVSCFRRWKKIEESDSNYEKEKKAADMESYGYHRDAF